VSKMRIKRIGSTLKFPKVGGRSFQHMKNRE